MRKIMILAMLCFSGAALAQTEEDRIEIKEVVIHNVDHPLNVALNAETVLCSAADYSLPFLKILIPELKDLTIFNHRNFNAAAPCVAAGVCNEPGTPLPGNIIDPTRPTEQAILNVQLVRFEYINHTQKTCQTNIIERLSIPIRGSLFIHERGGDAGSRQYEDCL